MLHPERFQSFGWDNLRLLSSAYDRESFSYIESISTFLSLRALLLVLDQSLCLKLSASVNALGFRCTVIDIVMFVHRTEKQFLVNFNGSRSDFNVTDERKWHLNFVLNERSNFIFGNCMKARDKRKKFIASSQLLLMSTTDPWSFPSKFSFLQKLKQKPNFVVVVLLLLFLAVQVNCKLIHTQVSSTVLETNFGKIRGLLVHFPKTNLPSVEVYLGLQYASLIGGELRFMPPTTSAEKWDNIRVASNFKPVCPQRFFSRTGSESSEKQFLNRHPMPDIKYQILRRVRSYTATQSEECLYLNIFAPVRG